MVCMKLKYFLAVLTTVDDATCLQWEVWWSSFLIRNQWSEICVKVCGDLPVGLQVYRFCDFGCIVPYHVPLQNALQVAWTSLIVSLTLHSCHLFNKLTTWCVVLEYRYLIVIQLVKKCHAFYGTLRFIAVFTASHMHPVYTLTSCCTELHFNIIIPHLFLGLQSGLFPSALYPDCLHFLSPVCLSHNPPISSFLIQSS